MSLRNHPHFNRGLSDEPDHSPLPHSVQELAEKVRAGLLDSSNALVPSTMTETAFDGLAALDGLLEQIDHLREEAARSEGFAEDRDQFAQRLEEQFEAMRGCLTEFCAFDWHATQHIAGLQHDGHDLRAIHAEDIEKLKRVRMKATTLLTTSNPAREPQP